ncbi:hypothetical protein D0525_16230 [Salmonella enterica]|uniref:hypothetical protein n=1 Tax=Salmonella enterica TaxID=28901 RepID=UPI0010127044|nr:hypothetical protein [Salmonella enterica]RXO38222.1 hypothetical protein D0525_16230 [Salmonella enterica]
MTSREQFEAWFQQKYQVTSDTMKVMQIKVELAWESWQASRAMIEIELPEPFSLARSASGLTYYYQDEVDAQIELSGLKIKGN